MTPSPAPPATPYLEEAELRAWVIEVGQRLLDALVSPPDRSQPVVRYGAPPDVYETFANHVGLGLRPGEEGHALPEMLSAVDDILKRAVRAAHPRFFNQNWAGSDPVAVLGDWLTALLNTTAATYEMAPLFTLMENELLERMASLAGLAPGREKSRTQAGAFGLFTPGGATANLYALHLARAHLFPGSLDEGVRSGPPLVALTSAHAHYSLVKAVSLLGLGRRALLEVPCDARGRMKVDALRMRVAEARERGWKPFFVNATAGTTVLGAFDDIEAIAAVAREEGMWLHVDGCYGGTTLFSERHRSLLSGSGWADSLSWNPHKLMGITQQCSVLLLNQPELLRQAFATQAPYLFQPDKNDAEQDLGDLTLQCGRRGDGLKLWLTWKLRGEAWFAYRIDRAVALAEQLEVWLRADQRFALAAPRSFANVCFWWVPPDLRPLQPSMMSPQVKARLHALAPRIKNLMQREGYAMLGYQPIDDLPNFFRLLVISPEVTEGDLRDTIEQIDGWGRQVYAEL